MSNGPTDILTPHGFIHQPSPLWPLPPVGADIHLTASSSSSGEETVEDSPNFVKVSMSRDALNLIKKDAPSYVIETDDISEKVNVEVRSQIQLYAANKYVFSIVCPFSHHR